MDDQDYTETKTKVKDLMVDDHFNFGDQLYRIVRIDPPQRWQPDFHIQAVRIKEDGQIARKSWIGVFALPKTKMTIYNQKVT